MIIQSENDNRQYKRIVLQNMLEVMIVYDKNTDVSSAALSVGVGNYMDPPNTLGLAHFLEHMLFMGTKKYPDTKYFMEFINKCGGLTNAHTGNEYTSYYYSITNDNFIKSLDIFAQFFIDPLFDKNNIDKEINAVNSEHSKNITNDNWRIRRTLSQMSNQDHPFHKFSTGTIETLSHDNIRNLLIDFYKKHYSANVMKLTVLSNIEIDKMENIVIDIFSHIKNTNYIPPKYNTTPFQFVENDNSNNKIIARKLVKMLPIYDEKLLHIIWDLPPSKKYFMYKPMSYITNLLNHEALECLSEQLKRKNWIYSLLATSYESDISCNLFGLYIKVTDDGFKHIPSIIEYVYIYINKIIENGIEKWRYDEMKKIYHNDFKFLDKVDPINYTVSISENLLFYPYEHALDVIYFFDDYNENVKHLYQKMYSRINKRKSIIIISSKEYYDIAIKKEKFYGIKYMDKTDPTTLGAEFVYPLVEQLNLKLELPKPNHWIPDKLILFETDDHLNSKYPIKLKSKNKNIKLWAKQDNEFNIPNVLAHIIIFTDFIAKNIKNYCTLILFFELTWYIIQSELYYAALANNSLSFSIGIEGYTLKINAYPSLVSKLLNLVIDNLFNPKIDDRSFSFVKNNIIVDASNYIYSSPLSIALDKINENMDSVFYTDKDMLECYKSLNLSDIFGIIDDIKQQCFIDALIIGNINNKIIKDIDSKIFDLVENKKIKNFTPVIKIKDKIPPFVIDIDSKVQNTHENDSAIIMSYQCYSVVKSKDNDWAKKIGILMLIEKFVKERFFNDLRTVQQSGYIVNSYLSIKGGSFDNVYVLNFNVQSSVRSLLSIQNSISDFVNDTYKFIDDMDISIFDEFKKSLISNLTKKYDNIYEQLQSYLRAINSYDYVFDSHEKLALAIKDINRDDVLDIFEDYFIGKYKKLRISKVYSRINKKID